MSKFHERLRADRMRELGILKEEVVSLFDDSLLNRARKVLQSASKTRAAHPAANSFVMGLRDAELLAECVVAASQAIKKMDDL